MIFKHFCTTTYIFNKNGDKCLLIRHKKLPFYLPPGGHIDENEDYLESSQREVAEERHCAREPRTCREERPIRLIQGQILDDIRAQIEAAAGMWLDRGVGTAAPGQAEEPAAERPGGHPAHGR